MKKITLLLLLGQFLAGISVVAQEGSLDTGFGEGGIVKTSFLPDSGVFTSLGIQTDNKIIASGVYRDQGAFSYNRGVIMRYNHDGSPDTNFGNDGIILNELVVNDIYYSSIYTDLVVLPDDTFIVCGYAVQHAVLKKFHADGTPFLNFGTNGTVQAPNNVLFKSLCIQPDGKIVVGGSFGITNLGDNFCVMRFNSDGTVDDEFGENGLSWVSISNLDDAIQAIAIDNSGRIVAAGYSDDSGNSLFSEVTLTRFTADGLFDATFGTNGVVTTSYTDSSTDNVYAMIMLPDDRFITGGRINGDMALTKYNKDGDLELSFSDDGFSIIEPGTGESGVFDLVLQPDNKIVAAGYYFTGIGQQGPMNSALIRLTPNGAPDNNFGELGVVITNTDEDSDQFSAVVLPADGGILCAGSSYTSFCMAKYKSTIELGVLDFSLANSVIVSPNPITPYTTLNYTLTSEEKVTLELFDLEGKKIQTFLNGSRQTAADYRMELDLTANLASGAYILVLSTPKGKATVKVVK